MLTKAIVLAALKADGYNGDESLEAVKGYIDSKSISLVEKDGTGVNLESLWTDSTPETSEKTVTITVTTTEDEQVVVETQKPEDTQETPDTNTEIETEVETAGDKSAGLTSESKQMSDETKNVNEINTSAKSFSAETYSDSKNYARKAAKGETFFDDADIAEVAGAWFRYKICNTIDGYAQKDNDMAILRGAKALASASSAVVPTFVAPYIMENIQKFGAARRCVGSNLIDMAGNLLNITDLSADAIVSWPGEATAGNTNSSTPTLTSISLVAGKMIGPLAISNELLSDSAVNISDYVANSFARAIAKQEDTAYFNGDNSTQPFYGLTNATGGILAGGQVAAAGATWASITEANINSLMAAMSNDFNHDEAGFACSRQFYFSVMLPLLKAKSGVNLTEAINGVRNQYPMADASWYGTPVYFANVLPTASAGTSRCLLYGVFGKAHALGVVRNSLEIATSDQYAFNTDQVLVRAKERIAVKPVKLGDASVSGGVVVLRTT